MSRLARVLAMIFAALLISAAWIASDADARPGGGQSFGGSKTSSGSRSSGGSSRSSSGGSNWSRSSSGGGSSKSKSSTPERTSEPWSSRPGYSAPWTKDETPTNNNPRAPRNGPSSHNASGSVVVFFFWIIVGGAALILLFVAFRTFTDRREVAWDSGVSGGSYLEGPQGDGKPRRLPGHYASVQEAVAALGGADDNFSMVLFEDFLYALFAEVHTARGSGRIELLDPYAKRSVLQELTAQPADAVTGIIVGAMRVDRISTDAGKRRVRVKVVFTANYTEKRGEEKVSYYVEEKWTLGRGADVSSRAPENARVIGCPNCGAALDKLVANKCRFCDQVTRDADHDWRIERIEILAREPRGPILTGTTEEVGTNDPTIVAPDAEVKYAELRSRDPAMTWTSFIVRVEHIFHTFHEAWSKQDLTGVRPFLTDALFDTQRYWVAAYKAQGLQNVTADRRVISVHLARVVRDAHYDAVTVRVFAACIDYTIDADAKVVGGSEESPREYSEYWTLIRAAKKTGQPWVDPGCPNCGAPASEVNMAGACKSCKAEITRGDFDWVLSRIEQDEVYDP